MRNEQEKENGHSHTDIEPSFSFPMAKSSVCQEVLSTKYKWTFSAECILASTAEYRFSCFEPILWHPRQSAYMWGRAGVCLYTHALSLSFSFSYIFIYLTITIHSFVFLVDAVLLLPSTKFSFCRHCRCRCRCRCRCCRLRRRNQRFRANMKY